MADYSCYLTVKNQTGHVLDIFLDPPQWGSWGRPAAAAGSARRKRRLPAEGRLGRGGVGRQLHRDAGRYADAAPGKLPGRLRPVQLLQHRLAEFGRYDDVDLHRRLGRPRQPAAGLGAGGGHPVYLVFTFTDTASPPPAPRPPKTGTAKAGARKTDVTGGASARAEEGPPGRRGDGCAR